MCGLVALAGWNEKFIADICDGTIEKICRGMTAAIAHRGNNGEGFFVSPDTQCMFGHRRLSIFDLSEHGNQPMTTPDGRFTIAYNGEIYNFKELKQELAAHGISFKSESDTEVLLQGYAAWSVQVFERLRGMFAGVIWDAHEQKLCAFRDHLGIKPLYWWQSDHTIVLASELRALLTHPEIPRNIRKDSVAHYFRFGSIHAPATIFESIYALEPGHYLTATATQVTTTEYWHPRSVHTRTNINTSDVQADVLRGLRSSIAAHMRSDIPVGAFLSGGLDSATIVALMKEQSSTQFDTFSVGFGIEGATLDESADAAAIAQHFGTRHHHVRFDGTDFAATFEHFIDHLDQPSIDGFNSYLVSRAASDYVRVALSGLGGDELFLGYRYHRELARLTQSMQNPGAKLYIPAFSYAIQKSSLLEKLAYHTDLNYLRWWPAYTTHEGYIAARQLFSHNAAQILLQKKCPSFAQTQEWEEIFTQESDLLNAYSKAELAWYTPGTLLRDADVTGMAFTLEVRFPFLDIPLINEVVSLPSSYKLDPRAQLSKPLLVAAMKNILPEACFTLPKRGFEMPIGFWLKQYGATFYEHLNASTLFEHTMITKLIRAFEQKPQEYRSLWACVVFSAWLNKHNLSFE